MPQALALAQRVVSEPRVSAHLAPLRRDDRAGLARQVAREEVPERPLADEADAGRVLLRPRRDADPLRDRAHLALGRVAQGEQHRRELRLREAMQEVALVLGRVDGLQQFDRAALPRGPSYARVVAGGDPVGAERARVLEERRELDLAVAQHVGIRRAPRLVLAQEMREHALAVLRREVDRLEVDADHVGDARRVDQILARRAVRLGVVVLPVLHEHADDVVALLLQQPRRDRRVDAAGHADDHARASSHAGLLASWRRAQGRVSAAYPFARRRALRAWAAPAALTAAPPPARSRPARSRAGSASRRGSRRCSGSRAGCGARRGAPRARRR